VAHIHQELEVHLVLREPLWWD